MIEQLRNALAAAGWTASDLARHTGYSRQRVSQWLHGERVTPQALARITVAFRRVGVTFGQA